MKVLLLQLSDIHIDAAEDPILGRAPKIADAVKNLEPNVDAVICALTGDVTWSGTSDQFSLALDFVVSVKTEIEKVLPAVSVRFVTVPGNHDCDFSDKSEARTVLLKAIAQTPGRLLDKSFADICLAPLQRFYEFRDALDLLPTVTKPHRDGRLYSEYTFEHGGETVAFCCCNTAVTSQLHEQPGALIFPWEMVPEDKRPETVTIGLFHHPVNWLEPRCASKLRDRMEAITDLILTGHEHSLDRRDVTKRDTENTYLEGGVLQERDDPALSQFYVVLIDTALKKQRIIGYSWTGDSYVPVNADDPHQFHLWEDFAQNRFRVRESFQLLPEFAAYLDDPELVLTHRVKDKLRLSDIYVFPDLKRVNLAGEKGAKIIRSENVPDLVDERPGLFIIGDDVAGKTSLAKRLFHHLRSKGDVPVLIDAASVQFALKKSEEQIEQCFLRNYAPTALTHYRQLDRAKRILIVDNYHQLKLSPRAKIDLLSKFREHSFRLIILAHDLEITFQDLSEAGDGTSGQLPFTFYSILPFSYVQQNRLLEKWLLLGGDADKDASAFVANLERIRRTIDTLIGKNYVPAYPPYVLSVLQATEAGTDLDLNASTHGYLYELFIKSSIARGSSAMAFNVLSAYMSHIAFWMFSRDRKDITAVELRSLHEQLHEKYEVLQDFERQTGQLIRMQLLTQHNDIFVFRQPYIFYYFLARYLGDHLPEEDVQGKIDQLAKTLYKEESANTLLFLSHLSKDRRILETLLAVADEQYKHTTAVTLGEDVQFLNKLDAKVGKLHVGGKTLEETRQAALTQMDVDREQELDFETSRKAQMEDSATFLGRLNGALKTIQILGQFLKNFPADLDRSEKDRVIQACCSLGTRTLGDFMGLVRNNETVILNEMLYLIGRRRPDISQPKLRDRAVIAVVTLCELATVGIVVRLSYALGSNELSPTYDRIFPSLHEPFMRLVYVALQLDHYERFPEGLVRQESKALHKNPFSFRVLRYLVARYLALFPTNFQLKQQLSELLNLDFGEIRLPKKEQQLLGD